MKKQLLLIFAALLPLLTSAYDFEFDGIYYNILSTKDLTIEVTVGDTQYGGDIVIPSTVIHEGDIYSVIAIGYRVFEDCRALTSIQLPQSVQSIGAQAFRKCTNLESIVIPEGVKELGWGAFMDCVNLSSITIPNSVTFIGTYAFNNTAWYDNQPDGLVYIGNVLYAYKGVMPANSSITVKEGITCITSYALASSELSSITIPESVSFMGEDALRGTTWYENQPEGPVYIGKVLYKYKGQLPDGISIKVKEGTKAIAGGAFDGCSNLRSIDLPETLISLGINSFNGCSKLTSIYIPKNIESIDLYAFQNCDNLTSIIVDEENETYDSRNNCNAIIKTANNKLIRGCSTTIFPTELKSIGVGAFRSCYKQSSLVIPAGVKVIEGGAFYGCEDITSVTIPESVSYIDESAFSLCNNLTSVHIDDLKSWFEIFFGRHDGGNPLMFAKNLYLGEKLLESISVPEGITTIKRMVLPNWSGKEIILPESVTLIEDYAFLGCSNLTTLTCKATNPPTIESSESIKDVNKSIPVYVPASSVEAYQTAEGWCEFTNIIGIEKPKCTTPSINYIDGKISLSCETEDVEFVTEVVTENAKTYTDAEFELPAIYTITAYATKKNYEDSDVAILTICWIPCTEKHKEEEEGTTGILTIPSKPVLISTQGGTITLSGLAADTEVAAHSTAGTQLATTMATAGTATLTTNLTTGDIAIVKIGEHSIKIVIK